MVEDYLTGVMPLGGRHADAMELMTNVMPRRLEKNKRLSREIANGLHANIVVTPDGKTYVDGGKFRIDNSQFRKLALYIAKGLSHYHWGMFVGGENLVSDSLFLTPAGAGLVDAFAVEQFDLKEDGNFADGALVYEGYASTSIPGLTRWRMKLYNVRLTGDARFPGATIDAIDVLTAPTDFRPFADLLAKMKG